MDVRDNFKDGNYIFNNKKENDFDASNFISLCDLVKRFNKLYTLYKKELDKVDSKDMIKRMMLIEKHIDLFNLYCFFKNKCVYYDGKYILHTKIDSVILEDVKSFSIGFGNMYGEYVCIVINIGKNFGIDYENSMYYENNRKEKLNSDSWKKVYKKTYISKEYIKNDLVI